MNTPLRRGACPSLSAPMETGDGLLVRLSPASGTLSPFQLAGTARAAGRHGNGLLEVTRRGNLQIRGLSPQSTKPLAADIAALDITVPSGIPVETGPLAGIDAQEIRDPRPLAEEIRIRALPLAGRLGPKVSVTVDGGGLLHLRALLADVKVTALADGWHIAIGGDAGSAHEVGVFDAAGAVAATLDVLQRLAARGSAARARDFVGDHRRSVQKPAQPSPVGTFALKNGTSAHGFALAFGQIDSAALGEFALALDEDAAIRLAPGGGLIVTGLSAGKEEALRILAARLGFVTQADDPRLSITACAGAPACRSAWVNTRALAAEVAGHIAPGQLVHLSGCTKGCARPSASTVTLTGTPRGCVVEGEDSHNLHAVLAGLGGRHFVQRKSA